MSSAYGDYIFDQGKGLKALEQAAYLAIKAQRHYDFDAMAVRGSSGIGFGYALSLATGIPLVVFRKPNENAHSGEIFPNHRYYESFRFAFLDDFIESGNTRTAIRSRILKDYKNIVCSLLYQAECKGIVQKRSFGQAEFRRTHSIYCDGACAAREFTSGICLHDFP